MVPMERFTEQARQALAAAQEMLLRLGQAELDTEHLALALIEQPDGLVARALRGLGVDLPAVTAALRAEVGSRPRARLLPQRGVFITQRANQVVDRAQAMSEARGDRFIGVEHLLLSILADSSTPAAQILARQGVDTERAARAFAEIRGNRTVDDAGAEQRYQILERYSRDLTALAAEDKLDPVIGRDEEILRVMEVLCRRTKNNPVLIGEPGVGKTAIVEGLARRIAAGDVPEVLQGKRVLQLDLAGMLAGAKFRGEFEERLKGVLDEIAQARGEIILFIDEIHTMVGAGAAEGAIDAANMMKPMLARGELRTIGATTLDEYRQHIEKDAALERRFAPVYVDEPTVEETVAILRGLKPRYEAHHGLTIAEETLEAAAKLSHRYIQDRFLPDKAIDVMDEACAKVRLRGLARSPEARALAERIKRLQDEEDNAWAAREYERAARLRQERLQLEAQQPAEPERETVVTPRHVAEVIGVWTGIPVQQIYAEEQEKLLHLEEALHRRVVEQDEAIAAVADAIRRSRSGLADPRRPIGSFLFLGPTGVGKTELAKALAEFLFNDESALLRLDMSEYMESHTVSRLFGAPPGYVGYDQGGQLTEAVRRRPYQVILFDEIEKAHPEVFNALLQILDDGRLTDGQGRTVDFRNTLIIMTSNVGSRGGISPHRGEKLGFVATRTAEQAKQEEREALKERLMAALKATFRPEFLNRIDEIIIFHRLSRERLHEVVEKMLRELRTRLADLGMELQLTEAARDWLVEHGYDEEYGARPLRRLIQRQIENPLARRVLGREYGAGDRVVIDAEAGGLTFRKEAGAVAAPLPSLQTAQAA